MSRILALLLALSAVQARHAVADEGRVPASAATDDSDLSAGPSPQAAPKLEAERHADGSFRAARKASEASPRLGAALVTGEVRLTGPDGKEAAGRSVTVLLLTAAGQAAAAETDASGRWVLSPPPGGAGPAVVRFRLENPRWTLEDRKGKTYEWQAAELLLPAPGPIDLGTVRPEPGTENAKLAFIHLQFLEAFDLFEREAGAAWWKKRLDVRYPDSADYFQPADFSLHLTRPEQWDVNLHELGHAVMAAGTRSHGGGGQHYIDRCYNRGLAWSEGWASFFAGAVRLRRDDPDAKFQFLVPRRAPIRVENVPEDVCRGDTNEWRVAAGLWDVYDSNEDGEDGSAVPFGRIWKAIEGKSMGGLPDAWSWLSRTLQPDEAARAAAALRQNSVLEAPSMVRPAPAPKPLAAPSWD